MRQSKTISYVAKLFSIVAFRVLAAFGVAEFTARAIVPWTNDKLSAVKQLQTQLFPLTSQERQCVGQVLIELALLWDPVPAPASALFCPTMLDTELPVPLPRLPLELPAAPAKLGFRDCR